MTALFVLGCAISPTGHQKLSQGYPFGSTHDFVLAALEADQFQLFDVSEDVIWHDQLIDGYKVSSAYVFDSDRRYSSSLWLVWDRSAGAFEAINDALANYYGVDFFDVSVDGITKFESFHDGTRVLHERDPSENSHSVHYYQTDSEPFATVLQ